TATPKLIDICWTALEMLLPLLASASERSAKTSVFMLVYCIDETKPREKGKEEGHAPDPEPGEEAAGHGDAERPYSEQLELKERKLGAERVPAVRQQQEGGQADEEEDALQVEGVLAEDLEDVGEKGDARAEEGQPDKIQGIAALGLVIGHVSEH